MFPIDMLRYDNCVPLTSEDASRIYTERAHASDRHDTLVIHLVHYSGTAKAQVTPDRWASFGWTVTEVL